MPSSTGNANVGTHITGKAAVLAVGELVLRVLLQLGHPAGAATAFQQLLTDQLRVLGPDHPDTLNARHNLRTGASKQAGNAAITVTATAEAAAASPYSRSRLLPAR